MSGALGSPALLPSIIPLIIPQPALQGRLRVGDCRSPGLRDSLVLPCKWRPEAPERGRVCPRITQKGGVEAGTGAWPPHPESKLPPSSPSPSLSRRSDISWSLGSRGNKDPAAKIVLPAGRSQASGWREGRGLHKALRGGEPISTLFPLASPFPSGRSPEHEGRWGH